MKKSRIKQKFPRGSRVKVADKLPKNMSHFAVGFEGIVECTYSQEYGGVSIKCYSLLQLGEKDTGINITAWYEEDQLTLLDSDTAKGKAIIEEYEYG